MIYLYTKPRDGVKYVYNRPMGWCAILSGLFNLPGLGASIAALVFVTKLSKINHNEFVLNY